MTLDTDISVSLFKLKKWIDYKYVDNKNVIYFGSRKLKNSELEYKFYRKIMGIIFSFLLKILFQIDIKDTQCGFKLYKKHGEYVNSGDRIAKIFCSDHSILSKGSFIFKKSISILKELPTLYKVIH